MKTQLVLTVKPTDKPTVGHETGADRRQNKDNNNDDPINFFRPIIWKRSTQGGRPRTIVVFEFRNSELGFFAEFAFGCAPFPSAMRRLVNADQTDLLVLENWNRRWKWLYFGTINVLLPRIERTSTRIAIFQPKSRFAWAGYAMWKNRNSAVAQSIITENSIHTTFMPVQVITSTQQGC